MPHRCYGAPSRELLVIRQKHLISERPSIFLTGPDPVRVQGTQEGRQPINAMAGPDLGFETLLFRDG